MKEGTVLIIGRPNVGKSTFINNLIGQKVAITSPKPQTTRMPIEALYEDERGKILFIDTPGIMGKVEDTLSKKINMQTLQTLNTQADIVMYIIDHTRKRDFEEARVIGLVRKIKKPVILVINKIDLQEKTYLPQYEFLKEEFPISFDISALHHKNFKLLMDKLFEMLPESTSVDEKLGINATDVPIYPLTNMDAKGFLSELIREKVFLNMGEEIPYTTTAIVDEIKERNDNLTYIKARILTTHDRYKAMIIGAGGRKIKELGNMARKEIALATGKKIYLDLTVETDPHWPEVMYK